jgi:Na+/melibiose symporter-like transporter
MLVSILITFLVVILILYLINLLPLDGRAKQIARVVVIILGVISLLRYISIESVFQRSMPSDLIRGWRPVRVKKTRQTKNLEPRSDSIGTEKALGLTTQTKKAPAHAGAFDVREA